MTIMLLAFRFIIIILMKEIAGLVILQTVKTDNPITSETMYSDYPHLRELDMSNQSTFEFPKDRVLLVHPKLSAYICNNCGVKFIYKQTFSKLSHLTLIELQNNSLEYVHPDAFEHNSRLDEIDFSGNRLVRFNPEATLRHISSLSIINLSQNPQLDVNQVKLASERLMIFSCNNCATTFLDRNTLAGMPRISQVNFKENLIEQIYYDAVESLNYLKTLNIDGNPKLQILSFGSKTLKRLSAQNCSLEGTLQTSNLPALTSINVRGNRITHLDELGLVVNQRITSLLLDDNKLEKIPHKLMKMPQLHRLCLDQNLLQPHEHIEEAVSLYRTRNLRHNCAKDDGFSHQFEYHLPSANGIAVYRKNPVHNVANNGSTIDLSGRNVVFIEQDYLVEYEDAKELVFNNNHRFQFKQSAVFLESRSIEILFMENCSITALYETTFGKLPNLKAIHLQGNKLRTLHSSSLFQQNPGLSYINLARNDLTLIWNMVFEPLQQLKVIILDQNRNLTNTASQSFLVSKSLRHVSCANCAFEQVNSQTVQLLPSLQTLNLPDNPIKSFNITHLDRLETLCVDDAFLDEATLKALENDIGLVTRLEQRCEEQRLSEQLRRNYNRKSLVTREATTIQVETFQAESLLKRASLAFDGRFASSAGQVNRLRLPLYIVLLVLVCHRY